MGSEKPIEWLINPRARADFDPQVVQALIPPDVPWRARRFHRQLPGYRMSPLVGLPNLAARLGLGGIWVKDKSQRLDLRSFYRCWVAHMPFTNGCASVWASPTANCPLPN